MQSVAKRIGAARDWTARYREARGRAAAGAGGSALAATLREGFDWAYGKAVSGMPGLDGAVALAARYAGRHASADEAVAALIAWQTGVAGVAGFLTGCGGFVALPVAFTLYRISISCLTIFIQKPL